MRFVLSLIVPPSFSFRETCFAAGKLLWFFPSAEAIFVVQANEHFCPLEFCSLGKSRFERNLWEEQCQTRLGRASLHPHSRPEPSH